MEFVQPVEEVVEHIMAVLLDSLEDQVVVELQNQEEHLEDQVYLIKVILEDHQVLLQEEVVVELILLDKDLQVQLVAV
jgi:hypothetical protein